MLELLTFQDTQAVQYVMLHVAKVANTYTLQHLGWPYTYYAPGLESSHLLCYGIAVVLLLGTEASAMMHGSIDFLFSFCVQDGRSGATGVSMESSGSNHTAPAGLQPIGSPTMQTANAGQPMLLPSKAGAAECAGTGADQTVGGDKQPQLQSIVRITVSGDPVCGVLIHPKPQIALLTPACSVSRFAGRLLLLNAVEQTGIAICSQ